MADWFCHICGQRCSMMGHWKDDIQDYSCRRKEDKVANVWMVYHQNPDYTSHPELPKAVFSKEADAITFAKAQKGYGLGFDWIVKPVDFNPPAPLAEIETIIYYEVREQTDEYRSKVIAQFKDKAKAEALAARTTGWYGAKNYVSKRVVELS